MAYSKQTFTLGVVLTAAEMNQVEDNISDHVHGSNGVTDTFTTISVTGSLNATGNVQVGSANGTEINFLSGVNSAIQTQIDNMSGQRGALVYKSSGTQTMSYSGYFPVEYDAESYDTDGFHSTVESTGILRIPNDTISRVKIGATFDFRTNTPGWLRAEVRKNGSHAVGLPIFSAVVNSTLNVGSGGITVSGPPVPVSSGDRFELYVYNEMGHVYVENTNNWNSFWLEVLV